MHATDVKTLFWLLLLTAQALLFVDMGQTWTIANSRGTWKEVGFARHFIGEHPTTRAVVVYFAACMAALAFLTLIVLNAGLLWPAFVACVAVILIQLSAVIPNATKGIGMFKDGPK